MATILTRQGKLGTSFVIHYYGNDRKSRFYLCLGQKYRRRQAEEIKILVENLLDAAATKRRLYPEEEEAVRRLPLKLKKLYEAKDCTKTGPVLTSLHQDRTQRAIDSQLRTIIRHAELEVWPRLNHNLRGSRSNEIFSVFPDHVAEYWMVQSQKVAKKHYLHLLTGQYNIALDFDKEKEQNEKTQQEGQSKAPSKEPSPKTCHEPEQQNDDLKYLTSHNLRCFHQPPPNRRRFFYLYSERLCNNDQSQKKPYPSHPTSRKS